MIFRSGFYQNIYSSLLDLDVSHGGPCAGCREVFDQLIDMSTHDERPPWVFATSWAEAVEMISTLSKREVVAMRRRLLAWWVREVDKIRQVIHLATNRKYG